MRIAENIEKTIDSLRKLSFKLKNSFIGKICIRTRIWAT